MSAGASEFSQVVLTCSHHIKKNDCDYHNHTRGPCCQAGTCHAIPFCIGQEWIMEDAECNADQASGESLIRKRVRTCSESNSMAERFPTGSDWARYFMASTSVRCPST